MQRKTVIFQIEKGNKIISEFSENITILFLKIYIRDRTNIKNFDLYFKRNLIKNNAMPLYKFFHHKNEKSITFFLKIKSDTNKNNIKLKSTNKENVNIYTNRNKLKNKQTIKLYEEEISYVKEKNNELKNNINKYKENINECVMKENKNKEKYLSLENLLNKQKEEIQMLKNEINDANIKYKDLKHKSVEKENRIKENQLKYTKSNSNFAIIKHPKPKRCLSVESFNTSYLIKKKEKKNHAMKSINLTNENVKKERNSFDNYQSKDKDNNNDSINKNNNNIKNNYQSKDKDNNNDSTNKNNSNINNSNIKNDYQSKEKDNNNDSTNKNNSNIKISNMKNNYQSKEKDNNDDNTNKNNNNIMNNYQSKDKDNNNDSINKNNNDMKNNYQSKEKDNNNDSTNKNNNNINNHNNSNNNNQLIISTNNISNVNGNNQENKNNYEVLNVNNAVNSRNVKFKNTNIKDKTYSPYSTNKPNDMKYKYQIKEYNTNIVSNNIINIGNPSQDTADNKVKKEEDEIDLNKIIDEFNKNNNIKQKLSRDDLLKNESLKLPVIYDSYFSIFKFLNNDEIYSYSSVNKSNGVCSLYYWMNYLENKITYLNDNYNNLTEKYKSLTQKLNECSSKSNSILSYFSKSGLRVLNSPHYLDIFNNPVDYFTKDNIFLFIYKMLFHFNKLYDSDNKSVSDNDFISLMQNEIKEKTKVKKSLKEYVNNVLDKEIDFSFEHVIKAKNIMKFYNIENIEGNQLAKIDRATTIIGYVVRDIMGFTGLIIKAPGAGPKNSRNKKVEEDISFSSLKNKIINVCEQINNEKTKCDNTIKKIKELITKYYNI